MVELADRKSWGRIALVTVMWLVFAAMLNSTIDRLNPGAGTSLLFG